MDRKRRRVSRPEKPEERPEPQLQETELTRRRQKCRTRVFCKISAVSYVVL